MSVFTGSVHCDPVVLFKLVLIQHLFGIRALRQTMRDVEVNVAYRWFLGYTMSQPHFATISYAFRHRFTAEVIEDVFRWCWKKWRAPGICRRKWCWWTERISRRMQT